MKATMTASAIFAAVGRGLLYTSRRGVRGTIRLRSDHSPDFIGRSIPLAAARGILRPGRCESWLPRRTAPTFPAAPRAGRYNTLDLASKVVRQRWARPSLGTLPNTGKSVATLHETFVFCRYSFSSLFSKTQIVCFEKTNENKKADRSRT